MSAVQHSREPAEILRALFDRAVSRALPELVVPEHLPSPPKGRTVVVGAGKASAAMAKVVEEAWPTEAPISGLVITRFGHVPEGTNKNGAIEIVEARHPVPDDSGVAATKRMLDLLEGLSTDDLVITLISGGASALLVAPAEGISLEEKQAITAALLASGAPIGAINTVRKHLSRVKAGRLAAAAWPAPVLTLMISDVPGDDPGLIGSGPTVGEQSSPVQALAILKKWNIQIPQSVKDTLSGASTVVPIGDNRLSTVENRVIAAPADSLAAAAAMAHDLQLTVRIIGDNLEGEAREVAAVHAKLALSVQAEMVSDSPPIVLLSGGELTVTRTGHGIGGPNAEYCLALALALKGAPGIHAIAGDTDGVDGGAEVAGAVVAPNTVPLAASKGADPHLALANNDAHRFFAAVGAQLITGPTLTNVNDFRALMVMPRT